MTEYKTANQTANWLKAIADPNRIAILWELSRGPRAVGELAELLGIALVNLSHHLQTLRYVELVATEKRGRFVIYTLTGGSAAPAGSLLLRHGPSQIVVELRPAAGVAPPPAAAA